MDWLRGAIGGVTAVVAGALGRARRTPDGFRALERKSRLVLTPQHTVHVLAVGGKTLVVGCCPRGFRILCRLDEAAEPAGRPGEAAP
jgi:flagellar biogenesis protein FliO